MMQHFSKTALLCRTVTQLQPSPLICAGPTLFTVHSRNTHIVKKITVKKMQTAKPEQAPNPQTMHKLSDERYIYESVRYEDELLKEPIDVLLICTVEGIGVQGEVVSMAPTRARKSLLLPRLGVYASPDNMKRYAYLKDEDSADLPSSKFARKTIAYLGGCLLNVTMNINEPWVLEPWHVRVAFRKANIVVPEYAIKIPEQPIRGPNLDFEKKCFYITVTVNNRETVRVMCDLHHVAGDPKYRLPWTDLDHREQPPVAILPQQQAYLTAMYNQRRPKTAMLEEQLTPEMVEQGITSTADIPAVFSTPT